ncbi:MAG TPA: glycosyltransferase [Bryobacteraceae bacterium]|nr:glycosyltransferase [Bryobacteraceae bacterium]
MSFVTAIVPSYGHHAMTREAVARLREQSRPPVEILVVDDGYAEPLEELAGARVLRHQENLGFAAAVNTGLRAAQTPLVAILNNDVTLAEDWLERLSAVITDQACDFVCGKLYKPGGMLDGTFDLLSRGGLAWRAGAGRPDGALWSVGHPILFTSFTALLARREVFAAAGELDESYHSYYEDVAWSLQAAILLKKGYYDPDATGLHTGSATAGVRSAYSTRQLLRNHRRLAHQYLLPPYRREYGISRALYRAHCMQHGQWPHIPREVVAPKMVGADRLEAVLRESEALLYELQRETGMDRLWRWYFQMAGRMA